SSQLRPQRFQIEGCVISGNTAQRSGGGAFTFAAENFVRDSVISANSASTTGLLAEGGGLACGPSTNVILHISHSTIPHHTAFNGGGVSGVFRTFTLESSDVHDNRATSSGGGIKVINVAGAATIVDSSISGNRAGDGGGASINVRDLLIDHTIVVG